MAIDTTGEAMNMQLLVAGFNEAIGTPRGDTPEVRAALLRAKLLLEETLEFIHAVGCRVVLKRDGEKDIPVGPGLAGVHVAGALVVEQDPNGVVDLVEAIDAAADVAYVNFGSMDSFGVDLAPFFVEVHRTNMEKLGGPVDENGKQQKPAGWKPPRIAWMLERYKIWKAVVPISMRKHLPFYADWRYFRFTTPDWALAAGSLFVLGAQFSRSEAEENLVSFSPEAWDRYQTTPPALGVSWSQVFVLDDSTT